MSWLAAQCGARERYAVPRGLFTYASLDRLYTDAWCRLPPAMLRVLPPDARRYGHRRVDGLAPVTSFEIPLAAARVADRLRAAGGAPTDQQRQWLDHGRRFSQLVRRDLRKRKLDGKRDALFIHSLGALESVRYARERGVPAIVSQLDPLLFDAREVALERARWPGWEGRESPPSSERLERHAAEWDAASAVVVHSRWSRMSAVDQGCPPEKLHVIPHAYEPAAGLVARAARPTGPGRLRVLWLGGVSLRKGIPYLIEAARLVPGVDVVVAGGIGVSEDVLRRAAPPNVRITGRVSESEAQALRAGSDVFVLPTLSDGFAVTQLEAMAAGLPVITTDHCGEVVADGTDGFVVPVRDPAAIAAAIDRLDRDRELLRAMSLRAPAKVAEFSLKRYVTELEDVLRTVAPDSELGRTRPSPSLADTAVPSR